MKRCVETHVAPGFGEIPAGSLWDDDSPYITNTAAFVDVVETAAAAAPRKATRPAPQIRTAVEED